MGEFLTIYLIGALISFILARSQIKGEHSFTVPLIIASIWPLAFLLKFLISFERR